MVARWKKIPTNIKYTLQHAMHGVTPQFVRQVINIHPNSIIMNKL